MYSSRLMEVASNEEMTVSMCDIHWHGLVLYSHILNKAVA